MNALKKMKYGIWGAVTITLNLMLCAQDNHVLSLNDLYEQVKEISACQHKVVGNYKKTAVSVKACPSSPNWCSDECDNACAPTVLVNKGSAQILTQPGPYCFGEDITDNIQVLGSDITIDMHGHGMYLPNNGIPGIAITGGVVNVRVKNGFISGPSLPTGTIGIGIFDAFETQVEDITIEKCAFGIILFGDENPYMPYNDQPPVNTVIQRVVCHDNTLGFFCINDFNTRIFDSVVYNNLYGVGSQGSTQIFMQGIESYGNQQQGFNVQGTGNSAAELVQCIAHDNAVDGFIFDGVTGVVVRDCSAFNNQASGFNTINSSKDVSFFNCVAEKNGLDGFAVFGDSASLFYCTATFNGYVNNNNGFNIRPNGTALVQGCTAQSNLGHGFNTTNSANQFYSNVACLNGFVNYNGVDVALITSPANARGRHNVDCDDTTPDEIEEILSILDSDSCGATVIIDTGTDQEITVPGRYCLGADFFHTLTIRASGVILDLNAHAINTQPGADGIVVDPTALNVQICNGLINGGNSGNRGISVGSAQDIQIDDITCWQCSTGIVLGACQRATLNRVHCVSNGGAGLECDNDFDTGVFDSSFIGNSADGIACNGSLHVRIGGCQANGNAINGIAINSSSHIEIENCNFFQCSVGLTLQQANDVVIRSCFACVNGGAGFNLQPSSSNIFIFNSVALSNGNEGFYVDGAVTNAVIRECTANNNFAGFGNSVITAALFYANSACNNGTNFGGTFNAGVAGANSALYWQNVDCNL